MTRGKRIAVVLGAVAGLLGLVAIGQQAGLGRGYALLDPEDDVAKPAEFGRIEAEPIKLAEFTAYQDIVTRPVFNESRAPEAIVTAPTEGEAAEPAAVPLNVSLTGVMLLSNLQLAFVRDNATNTVQRVRVGNPLEGEQSGWKLVELKPRGAVFEGEGLGRQEVELAVDTAGAPAAVPPPVIQASQPGQPPGQPLQPGMVAAPPGAPTAPPTATPPPPAQANNADYIRQRIEERRRQLREEAQRMMQDQNKQQ